MYIVGYTGSNCGDEIAPELNYPLKHEIISDTSLLFAAVLPWYDMYNLCTYITQNVSSFLMYEGLVGF